MSAGGSVFVPRDASTPRKPRREPERRHRSSSGVDMVELAAETLFPGVRSRDLTLPQFFAAVRMAKAHLVEIGQWPESVGERKDKAKAADRYAARKSENARRRAEVCS